MKSELNGNDEELKDAIQRAKEKIAATKKTLEELDELLKSEQTRGKLQDR
jgi:hypothetical protein